MHSLQLRSSHKLSLFLSLSLALFKSIANIATKAMKCIKNVCELLWMRQLVTDNEWLKEKKKRKERLSRCSIQWAVLRCIFLRLTWWSVIVLLIHFIICSIVFLLLHVISDPIPCSLSLPYRLMILSTHQSNHSPLWSALYFALGALKKKKKDTAPTIGQNVAHSHCLSVFSVSPSILFYSVVYSQCRTMQRRRTGWRLMTGLVTWWDTKATMSKIPLCSGTCVTAQPWLQPFFVVPRLSLACFPSGHNDKAPICCGAVGLPPSELLPRKSFSFVREWRSHFIFDTSLFYTCDRYEGASVPRRNVLDIW